MNDLLVRDGYRVSFDIDTLRNGDFDTQLLTRIEECQDFILIVDGNAFDRTLDPTFDRDKDWLRCELAHALKHNKNIIPIFLAGVIGFPDGLPDDIVDVVKKNAPEYNRYYFDAFYDKLKNDFIASKNDYKFERRTTKRYSVGSVFFEFWQISKRYCSSSEDIRGKIETLVDGVRIKCVPDNDWYVWRKNEEYIVRAFAKF